MSWVESVKHLFPLPSVHLYYIASVENKITLFIYLRFQHTHSLKAQKQTKVDIFLNKAADKSSAG